MNQILLNSSNYSTTTNSLRYEFPFAQQFEDNFEIGISDLVMYNQFFNISAANANNSLIIVEGSTEYILTIPDSFCTFTDLNNYLASFLKEKGLIITIGSTITYPIIFTVSKTSRQNQIILNPFNGSYCQVKWPSGLSKLYGFSYTDTLYYPKTKPTGTISRTYSQHLNSDLYIVNSIYLTCNLLNNFGFGVISDMLVGLPTATTDFGDLINLGSSQNQIDFMPINPSVYKYIEIKFYDQDFNLIKLFDSNMLICLAIKKIKK